MKTILLIEEDVMMRENTTEILELSNYRVFPAENGNQGLELAMVEHPDIIICDLTMPYENGVRLFKKIKDIGMTRRIPFIIIAAQAEKMEANGNLPDGADLYLSKPFEGGDLLIAVENCLKMTSSP
jgi:CRP/FNR family transcriptional regulator, cyclic AMP receptor protein